MNRIIRPLPTEDSMRRLREKLAERVPAKKLKERDGPGRTKIKYVTDDYILTTLDEIFGPLNWTREVLHETIVADFIGAKKTKKITDFKTKQESWVEYDPHCLIASARCRITIRFAGRVAIYEDVGTNVREVDLKDKPAAYMIAVKGAVTDGYKRCAAQIGNIFGRGLATDGSQLFDPDYSDAIFEEVDAYTMTRPIDVADETIIDTAASETRAATAPAALPPAAPISEPKASAAPAAASPATAPTPTAPVAPPAPPAPAAQATPPAASAQSTAASAPTKPASDMQEPGKFAPGGKIANGSTPAATPPATTGHGVQAKKTLDDLRAEFKVMEANPEAFTAKQWHELYSTVASAIGCAEARDLDPIAKALSLIDEQVQKLGIAKVVPEVQTFHASVIARLQRRRAGFGLPQD